MEAVLTTGDTFWRLKEENQAVGNKTVLDASENAKSERLLVLQKSRYETAIDVIAMKNDADSDTVGNGSPPSFATTNTQF